ncbi:carboxypeptidase M32 [Crateriforma conspicua]|uniref:Metal-dependent carboxypeptidase n=1 Tax=Crateriforma conspicua TaxID=2527996 RepID=A0A5C5Y795_9PLAN|nr:carboxypeptidase M32 [Crateriforma conspicua]TWT70175.1 Thermostable carboxypeptidase 1 [Crateriforma conspicua]
MSIDDRIFADVCDHARKAAMLQTIADTLEWDERTGMPSAAGEYRAQQVSTLRAQVHRLRTDAKYGEQLATLSEQAAALPPHGDHAATIRELNVDFRRDSKLPEDLVQRLSLATVRGQQSWDAARKADDYRQFKPALAEILALKKEQGDRYREGSDATLYESLLDEFEPGGREAKLAEVFQELRSELVPMIEAIGRSPNQPDLQCVRGPFDLDRQRAFSHQVCESIGFDFSRGRLDETSHPFCTTLGPDDIRILTRYESTWLPGGLYGSMHEAGHGIYEQGLRADWFGLPPGSYASLSVHESQSRLWENQVGRSRAFWQWLLPQATEVLDSSLEGVSADEFYFATNAVGPSLIRVEADEATYNLHIIIRFDLERQLIAGDLSVDQLPEAWNARYESDLGIRPTSDADGVLQDVHWSAGLFGYFPTYTLGNLIAAQLFATVQAAMPDLEHQIATGEFGPLCHWLRKNVHEPGKCYRTPQLVQKVTGNDLSAAPLISYLKDKLSSLYQF